MLKCHNVGSPLIPREWDNLPLCVQKVYHTHSTPMPMLHGEILIHLVMALYLDIKGLIEVHIIW